MKRFSLNTIWLPEGRHRNVHRAQGIKLRAVKRNKQTKYTKKDNNSFYFQMKVTCIALCGFHLRKTKITYRHESNLLPIIFSYQYHKTNTLKCPCWVSVLRFSFLSYFNPVFSFNLELDIIFNSYRLHLLATLLLCSDALFLFEKNSYWYYYSSLTLINEDTTKVLIPYWELIGMMPVLSIKVPNIVSYFIAHWELNLTLIIIRQRLKPFYIGCHMVFLNISYKLASCAK